MTVYGDKNAECENSIYYCGRGIMSELLNYIKSLLDDVIEYENNMMSAYARLNKACEGLQNEKFTDVAGLKTPNFVIFMQEIKERKDELENIKFVVETQIKNNEDRIKKEERLERKAII